MGQLIPGGSVLQWANLEILKAGNWDEKSSHIKRFNPRFLLLDEKLAWIGWEGKS